MSQIGQILSKRSLCKLFKTIVRHWPKCKNYDNSLKITYLYLQNYTTHYTRQKLQYTPKNEMHVNATWFFRQINLILFPFFFFQLCHLKIENVAIRFQIIRYCKKVLYKGRPYVGMTFIAYDLDTVRYLQSANLMLQFRAHLWWQCLPLRSDVIDEN